MLHHPYPNCAQSLNLHAVWDARIIHKLRKLNVQLSPEQERAAAKAWAEELHDPSLLRRHHFGSDGSVPKEGEEAWFDMDAEVRTMLDKIASGQGDEREVIEEQLYLAAVSSNELACKNALAPGKEWLLTHDLAKEYYDDNSEVVETLVKKGGISTCNFDELCYPKD